jgi:hypothetical protein
MSAWIIAGLVACVIIIALIIILRCVFSNFIKEYGWWTAIIFLALVVVCKSSAPIADMLFRRREKKIIIAEAIKLYEGNKKAALRWLDRPNYGLGNISPNQAIKLGRGKEVLHIIGRLENGVFS